ncbi:DivIVA domain-containing protein [Clostridium sp. Cult2]|uniref:DivIVA domain-containing protein n=1 Tax=Clostridium sp. Cult2 TaxID=2079003 RepID=UPI001F492009|nr:DivIVA domain-containing protein [Clostridium sp. Cult2]MCF6466446.1 septum formation initiator [Clostridium sp. Cult2]
MITPLDIQNKEFKKTFRGYKESEVDQFLDEIIDDYEKLYRENIELKDKILVLNEQIKQYNNLEKTLKDTLVVAQSTADDVTRAARQKSEIIIDEAELSAKKMIEAAKEEVKSIQKEYENLRKEVFIFRTRYKSFIEAQLITLDEFYSKIEKDASNVNNHDDLEDYIDESDESELESESFVEVDKNVDNLGA